MVQYKKCTQKSAGGWFCNFSVCNCNSHLILISLFADCLSESRFLFLQRKAVSSYQLTLQKPNQTKPNKTKHKFGKKHAVSFFTLPPSFLFSIILQTPLIILTSSKKTKKIPFLSYFFFRIPILLFWFYISTKSIIENKNLSFFF